jgi:MFS family permease
MMARTKRNRTAGVRDDGRRTVDVEGDGLGVRDARRDVGVSEARRRFGGIDLPASLVGMLTALAFLVLFAGLVGAAIGAIGYQTGLSGNEEELSVASLVGGLVGLFLAYLLGGWTAGRIARYDGPLNGAMTGVWTLVLAAILGGLGAWLGSEYDVLRNVDLPQWFSRDALTAGAIASGVLAIAAMLVGGALGGAWGERFHRRADATIAETRPGGIERGAVRR